MVAREGRICQGRSTAISISAPMTSLSVVVPCAPICGNRPLAKVAPIWIDTMAPISAATGKGAASRRAIGVDVT